MTRRLGALVLLLPLAACAESIGGTAASLAVPGDADTAVVDAASTTDASATAALPTLPSKAFLSGETPSGTDFVALVRGELVTEHDWDRRRCGPVPPGGVCAKVTLRNFYAARRLEDVYVQLTSLAPRAPTAADTRITFRSDATADEALGVSDVIGLASYPPLGPAGAPDDRADRYWVFESATPGPVLFHFRAVVKARLADVDP